MGHGHEHRSVLISQAGSMDEVQFLSLCGTRTRKLFAIAWRPFSIWLMAPTKTRPHKPMLAEWTSEILSL